jgi:hypothetical protein
MTHFSRKVQLLENPLLILVLCFSILAILGSPDLQANAPKQSCGSDNCTNMYGVPCADGVPSAVESCAAVHCQFTPPPARWLAAIHPGSPSGPTDPGSP